MRHLGIAAMLVLVACDGGGDTDTDPDTDTDTDSDTGITDTIEAVAGERCPLDTRIGTVQLEDHGGQTAGFSALIWNAKDPWVDAPTLQNAHCAFHTFNVNSCGRCDPGTVCSVSGACVPERRTIKDFTLIVDEDGTRTEHQPTVDGYAYGQVAGGARVGFELRWAGRAIRMAPVRAPAADLGATVEATGDYSEPGTLTASWTDPGDQSQVSTVIPINHHAGGPTYTVCTADASDEGFVADAEMVDPLAVITGLEFQGLHHEHVAAATVDEGCIEFTVGRQRFVDVQFPR